MRHHLLCGLLLALGTSACSGSTTEVSSGEEEPSSRATLRLPLEGHASDGSTYRLHQATFRWSGADSGTAAVAGRQSLSVDVAPGDYTLTLEPGFRLVRIAGGAAYPVDATLVSENWQNLWVAAGAEATAVFRFEIEGQWVALGGSFVPTTPGVPAGVGGTPGSTPSGPLEPSEPYGDSLISHDGWVDGANNVFGISGSFWTLSDGTTSVSPLDYSSQPVVGENCMSGTTAALQNDDYSAYWGAMIGFSPHQETPGAAALPYDANAHSLIGFGFRVTGSTGGQILRFLAGPPQLSDGTYETYCKDLDLADCADGCEVELGALTKDCWLGGGEPIDPTNIDHFAWQVANLDGPTDFDICVSDFRGMIIHLK